MVIEEFRRHESKYKTILEYHPNQDANDLLSSYIPRRLKKTNPLDLAN